MNGITAVLVAGAAVLVLAVLLLGGLRPGATVSTSGDSGPAATGMQPSPPADSSYGLVYGTHRAESGLRLFGWQITSPRYVAQIGFVLPPGCAVPVTGQLMPEGACARIPASGEVSGSGTTADGHALVIISVTVSKACYEALRADDPWPSDYLACSDG